MLGDPLTAGIYSAALSGWMIWRGAIAPKSRSSPLGAAHQRPSGGVRAINLSPSHITFRISRNHGQDRGPYRLGGWCYTLKPLADRLPIGRPLLNWLQLGRPLADRLPLGRPLLNWLPIGRPLPDWFPIGWPLADWRLLGWPLADWLPLGSGV